LHQDPVSQLFTLAPVRTLHLRLSRPEDILAVAASEQLRNLTTLNLRGNHGSPRLLAAIECRIEGRRTAQGCTCWLLAAPEHGCKFKNHLHVQVE
jgi:hypothetical protein